MDYPEATSWKRNGRSHWLALIVVVLLVAVMAVGLYFRSQAVAEAAAQTSVVVVIGGPTLG